MLNKKYGSLVVAVSFFIGISVSVATSIKINMAENNKIRQTEREKYRDLLPFLMETQDGVPIKAKVKNPILISINLTGEERKQVIKAIQDLDKISNTLNYKILDNERNSIYADINISVDTNLLNSKGAFENTSIEYNTRTGYLKYPMNITIDDTVANYYSSNGVSLVEYVIKHEMMHTLGFKDIYDKQYFDKTIMWHSIDNEMNLDNFSSLDVKNIKTMYDQNQITVTKPENMNIVFNVKQKEEECSM